jgi:hypothetical protein
MPLGLALRQHDLSEPVGQCRSIGNIDKLDGDTGPGVTNNLAAKLAKLNQSADKGTFPDLDVRARQRQVDHFAFCSPC